MTRREAGFSLVEVLAAVAVFAAVSAISVGLLAGALRSKEQGEAALERLAAVQRASALLREDIGQITPRSARTEEGLIDPRLFAADIEGTEQVRRAGAGREILVLTRTGWANPGAVQPRSTLQRVAWILQDGALYREVRAYPDAAPGLDPRRQLILDGLGDVRLDMLAGGSWITRARIIADGEAAMTPPEAVRLRYELAGLGAIEHVALSPSAEAR
jgi:general secretion pathway protein J